MVRIAALVVLIGGTLAAGPAAAQFGNIFGDAPPPRPPADIPNGPFPEQPPPPRYPGQAPPYGYPAAAPPPYPAAPAYPASVPPPSGVQVQPLPPPRGAVMAPVPAVQNPAQKPPGVEQSVSAPPPPNGAPPANAAAPAPQPAAAAPPPDDTVIEAPTQHIDNRRAVFSGLDKITGRTFAFDAALGETVQFGALQVTPRACYTRRATEATNTDAFVEVDEVTLKGEIKRIFTGWMYAASPGLHAVEHPIYDVWLTNCGAPVQTTLAEPAAAAPTPPPARVRRPAPPPAHPHPARPLARAMPPPPQPH